jgi:DNA-binding LacI/PurR family transcriptional regulator
MSSLLDRHLRVPKYLQLAEALRQQIASGELLPGDQLPSYVQMRQRHGATQNTVDKVFALLEQDGLITRERSRGTFVRFPEAEVVVSSGIIGISSMGFLVDGNSSYWTEILRGMRDAATRAGRQLLLLDHNAAAGWDKADGVVVCDWGAGEIINRLAPRQPAVSILVDVPSMPSVMPDDFSGGRLATEHLLSLGHRRIGVLHGGDRTVMPLRLAGYRQALQAAGVTPEENWQRHLSGPYKGTAEFTTAAHRAMERWLTDGGWKKTGCTALFCQNDSVAVGAIEALRAAGLEVPRDVSVVGYDGTDLSRLTNPPLTTIDLPLYDIGAQGVELLLLRLQDQGEVPAEHRMLPVHLIERASTAPPRTKPARAAKTPK